MNPKLIICIDGLGYDLISKENTPFLHEFGTKNNLSVLKTFFAFTGIEYSFFMGNTPEENKIWLEFSKAKNSVFNNPLLRFSSYNKKLRTLLGAIFQYLAGRTYISALHNIPAEKLKYFDSSAKEGLWKLPYFQSRSFSFYKWPFLVTKGDYAYASRNKTTDYASRNTTTKEQPRRLMPEPIINEPPKRRFGFSRRDSNDLKIADLKEMKKKQEETGKKPVDSWEEERSQDDEKFLDKEDEDFFDDDV